MPGLIVPIDVTAYCVGTVDAHGPARAFAGASTDYRAQTTDARPAYLGINVTRDADFSPLWPLEAGVHLHWAMPDALTRADSGTGQMTFPALPNRWLVTRIVGDGRNAKHWIVCSDVLSTTAPGGMPAPTVPVAEGAGGAGAHTAGSAATQRGFRYLGGYEVFSSSWAEPSAQSGHQTLSAVTHHGLHAVATGDIAFAAFYPNSRSSFGFRDDLADLTAVPAELLYVVTGWYGTPGGDPLSSGLTLEQLRAQRGWTTTTQPPGPVSYSLYSGLVQGIQWDPATRYLTDEPEPVAGDVAIGNHPAEALAAYFRGVHPAGNTAYEELLTLYLTGLLPQLATPATGQLALLEEALHELQFTGIDGGTVHTITRGPDEVADLPLPLADALNLLNTRQQEADLAAAQVWQAQWRLFSSWYRLFEVTAQNQNPALSSFSTQFGLQQPIITRARDTAGAAAAQKAVVEAMLTGGLTLSQTPASRYHTATEPVVLLAGDAAAPAIRYGGDGRYHPAGYLVCRLDTDVLSALNIGTTTLRAATYEKLAPARPNQLPYQAISTLIEEAALLDTAIGAAAGGLTAQVLAADLIAWLERGEPEHYNSPVGVAPSPVEVAAWDGANPWMSLTLLWETRFHPLLDTTTPAGAMADYPAGFFTANYRLDPGKPRTIAYAPGSGGITVDPAAIDWDPGNPQSGTCRYTGHAVLSTAAADNLRNQLAKDGTLDPALRAVADLLARTDVSMQGLTGFNDALLTREPSLQLAIGVSPKAPLPFRTATTQTTTVITSLSQIPPLAPRFNGNYSGVRAGYAELVLQVMDPFGRKRPVQVSNLYIADSLVARAADGTVAPGVIYLQPRVAQESRLLYRWLAADTTEYDEMNVHPATTPICGWLLPDHLAVGFFLYTAQGDPLGSLTLRADGSGIVWQATPGDQATIDADLATVMAHQNPHLRELALALGAATPARFRAFWQAADTAITQIVPSAQSSQSGLATLVGRPLALVQASLRFERQGLAALDQTFATLSGGRFTDTDHQTGHVRFPVVIGDLERLDDGLVGYFRQSDGVGHDGYDTGVFYSQAASGADPGVVKPGPDNLLLQAQATPETALGTPRSETKLLMLVDPRAAVHATMGIVPTQTLVIPPDQYTDTLAGLELTFHVFPLLRAPSGPAMPLPAITGYDWSWITEESDGQSRSWAVDPDLSQPTADAVWQYSPQSLTEGWLRLNPALLRFRLSGDGGVPVVVAGATTALTLVITNMRGIPVTFTPGSLGSETRPVEGSVFFVHFGTLVDKDRVAEIVFDAAGWRFQALTDARYGSYWAATPRDNPVNLAPGESVTITLSGVAVAAGTRAQSRVNFDYYNLTGLDDGVNVAILAVRQPTQEAAR